MRRRDFVGTMPLIKLALKADRVKLPVWVIGISFFLWIATGVNAHFNAEEMTAIVMIAAANPAMRMLVSPIMAESVTEVSRFVFFRFSFVFSILVSVMSIQVVTRHTRSNEETGRAEMVGSMVTGRHAQLGSAIAVGIMANLVLAILMGVALIMHGLPVVGSLATGAAYGGLGIAFTGVSAIAAQLSSTASGSNGIGALAFGGAFAVNGFANALGPINPGGLGFQSSRMAWFTPMGWTQRFYPFDERNWWILALFFLFSAFCSLIAFLLVNHRDVGRGMLADRGGRADAQRRLLSPLGVAWRLQRGSLVSWTFPMIFMAVMLGVSAESLGETMGSTDFFSGAFSDAIAEFPFLTTGIAAMAAAIYSLTAVLRMRSEEEGGPLENVLSTPVTRSAFIAGHTICAIGGGIALVVAFALTQALAMGLGGSGIIEHVVAGVFQSVGLIVLVAFALSMYGLLPRRAGPISTAVVLVMLAAGPFFGTALNLPDWLMNFSPFTHIAFMPGDVSAIAIAALVTIGAVLGILGFASFARRDLTP